MALSVLPCQGVGGSQRASVPTPTPHPPLQEPGVPPAGFPALALAADCAAGRAVLPPSGRLGRQGVKGGARQSKAGQRCPLAARPEDRGGPPWEVLLGGRGGGAAGTGGQMGWEAGKGPLAVPEGWVPQAGHSGRFSAARSRWGDLEPATCSLHPPLGNKRAGADPLCGPCPRPRSGTASLSPGLVRKAALVTQNVLLAGAPGGSSRSLGSGTYCPGLCHAGGGGGGGGVTAPALVCGLFLKLLEQTIRVK